MSSSTLDRASTESVTFAPGKNWRPGSPFPSIGDGQLLLFGGIFFRQVHVPASMPAHSLEEIDEFDAKANESPRPPEGQDV